MAGAPPPLPYGNETLEIYISFPPKVHSAGVWEDPASPSAILTYSLPLLELQVLLVFLITHLVHAIFKPLGVTYFASQMFGGMILGMLGKVKGIRTVFFTADFGVETLETAALFGFSMFMFLMGVKMDLKTAFKTSSRAILIGIMSLLSPMLVGLAVYQTFKEPHQTKIKSIERLMGITIESLTSSSVITYLLSELKILNSELGRLALSASFVCDLSTLFLVYAISSTQRWSISPEMAVAHFIVMVGFVLVIFFVFRPLMFRIIRGTPDGRPVRDMYIVIIVMIAMGSSLFTTSAMKIHRRNLFADLTPLKFSLLNIVLSFHAKFLPCFVASFWGRMPFRDSLAFALIMSSKGVVELAYFSTFRDIKHMSTQAFGIFTLGILVNATITPILVKFLYDSNSRKYTAYQKRNLLHLKPDAELRILACVHRPEHVSALIDVLDITCPTKTSPNVVFALHLVELAGRDSPVFTAHQNNDNVVGCSYEHILAFRQYEENNRGLVTVNAFTAISPPKLMHEDVCTMALNKQTSFILLPFHRKWSFDGSIEVENNVIRNLNRSVMDRAPCSVGILITRGVLDQKRKSLKIPSRTSSYSIGMLFLGGKDDREALTLAKRMARDPRVKLTVIHLTTDENRGHVMDWDMMLDAEILRDSKHNDVTDICNIMYREEVSNSGPEATRIIRSIANEYDLIIVGRRDGVDSVQTKGLSEWSEFPELGAVGDLLASTDLDSSVSVLVVQQQHHRM
ncbi:hypothetical protein V6N13_077821 [Hibiscus sabdariffa]|uniref:Cation/H+ exchanger domain-containing protein n=1 Tax=Hibiscus sabdariffa TaxID=183260 RepID=A0ABR2RM87_9ROSI